VSGGKATSNAVGEGESDAGWWGAQRRERRAPFVPKIWAPPAHILIAPLIVASFEKVFINGRLLQA